MNYLALLSIFCSALALLSLAALHIVSPEFSPSWRMVSEYALGKHKWLITTFFYSWGLSGLLLAVLLTSRVQGLWPILGVILLYVSAIGAVSGGLFDVRHKMHGLAFGLGVPTLPLAALLVGYYLVRSQQAAGAESSVLLWSHAPWISLVIMGTAMAVMITGFNKAGVPMGPDIAPPDHVPDGVVALAGYTNRLLVACYIGWLIAVARLYLSK